MPTVLDHKRTLGHLFGEKNAASLWKRGICNMQYVMATRCITFIGRPF